MDIRPIASILLVTACSFVHADSPLEPPVLTIAQALELTYSRNPAILSNAIGLQIDDFNVLVERREVQPIASVNGRIGSENGAGGSTSLNYGSSIRWKLPSGSNVEYSVERDSYSALPGLPSVTKTFRIIQPLLKGFGTEIALAPLKLAELQRQTSKLNRNALVNQVLTGAIDSYRAAQRAAAVVDIAKSAIKRTSDAIYVGEELVKSGRMASADLIQSMAELEVRKQLLAQADAALEAANLNLLSYYLGDPAGAPLTLEVLAATNYELPDPEEVLGKTLQRQPEYQAALLTVEQLKIQHNLAVDSKRPDVSLTLASSKNRSAGFDLGRATTYGVVFSIPINDLSIERSSVASRVALSQATLNLTAIENRIRSSLRQLFTNANLARSEIALAKSRLELSQKKLSLEQEKLRAGRSSTFQLTAYQEDVLQSALAELNAKVDLLAAGSAIDRMMGATAEKWGFRNAE